MGRVNKMGFDFKDIADIIPFIFANIEKCVYIILVCLFIGFVIGRFTARIQTRKRKQLEADFENLTQEKRLVQTELNLERARNVDKTSLSTLSSLENLLNSENRAFDLSALIELNIRSNANKKPE